MSDEKFITRVYMIEYGASYALRKATVTATFFRLDDRRASFYKAERESGHVLVAAYNDVISVVEVPSE